QGWTGWSTRSTRDALGGVIEGSARFGGLQTFAGRLPGLSGDEERHDFTVGLEEWFHIHDRVFLNMKASDGFHGDWLGSVKVLEEDLACQTVNSVDAHGI